MKYFSIDEFKCPCCGEAKMDHDFLAKIEQAREKAGIPFGINSGYRCDKHNAEVGSTSQNHVSGKACDVKCTDGQSRFKIVKALLDAGFKRIGVAKTFIHADSMDAVDSIWFY